MVRAKDIRVKPIAARDANRIIKRLHYSGKVTQNAQIHLGVFHGDTCGGAMQFGPPISKHKSRGLVEGTGWHEFIELARLAFADWLPRNSESRALGYAMRWLRKTYPQLKWVQSFADATQCGDGTIYRAAGFVLTSIKPNRTLLRMPDGTIMADKSLNNLVGPRGGAVPALALKAGATFLPGFQLRYVYFLDPAYRERLTVPELPYSAIDEAGAKMYRGQRARSLDTEASVVQTGEGAAMRPVRSTT